METTRPDIPEVETPIEAGNTPHSDSQSDTPGDIQSDTPSDIQIDPNATCEKQILQILKSGQKTKAGILEAVSKSPLYTSQELTRLTKENKIERVVNGVYKLPEISLESRTEEQNTETINKMLNLYDKLLDVVAGSIEDEDWDAIVGKIETIKSLRWLGATVDQLMKRWYLVHRGYDSNTKQAHEDAKQKTVDREKRELESAPPQSQLKVVREYGEGMRDILAKMPQAEQKKTKV